MVPVVLSTPVDAACSDDICPRPEHHPMNPRWKPLIIAIGLLMTWKIVRTDWIVSAPYWFGDSAKTESPGGDHTTYDIFPPVSALWQPPVPSDVQAGATNWNDLYPGGGAWGIEGPPILRPYYELIAVKILVASIFAYPLLRLLQRFLCRKRSF